MTALTEAIKKVATGPHLSKDLSLNEARLAMLEILSDKADPVQAAIFFIALRMKRETKEENLGILQALQTNTDQVSINVDQLLTIADPFNGYNRHCPITAFLPAVLAACGLPTVSQGVKEMGPKFGVTHSQVLAQAGVKTDLSVQVAAQRLTDSNVGWTYIDQAQTTPTLHDLQDLRTRMIKRPSLATLEKLIMPIKARGKTHLQIGFVHKAYPEVLAWLAQQAGFSSVLIVRGLEGGIVPTLRETSNCFRSVAGELTPCVFDPTDFDIHQDTRGTLPETTDEVTAQHTVELGLKALEGQSGPAFDSLVYGGAMVLWHCGLQPSQHQAAQHVRQVIQSGKAKACFELGID
ncbi:MAG: glycosyl transferase [Gammaproteobacteria bacterium]|nr:glycosyl transferase [Gammaproteobacteria bacterium]